MGWFRRGARPDPDAETDDPRVAVRCTVSPGASGGTRLEVTRSRRLQDVPFPGLRGVVLREPADGAGPEGWTASRSYRCSESATVEVLYRAPFLLSPLHNLDLGEVVRHDLRVPPGAVAGVLIGSRTDKLWLDDGAAVTWLLSDGALPGLHGWADQIGTDPQVRIVDLDTSGGPVRLVEREVVRLSDLRDAED